MSFVPKRTPLSPRLTGSTQTHTSQIPSSERGAALPLLLCLKFKKKEINECLMLLQDDKNVLGNSFLHQMVSFEVFI